MDTMDKGYDVKITPVTGWDLAYKLALATEGKDSQGKEPSDAWKRKILLARHSPIRAVQFLVEFTVPYWVSVHLVRHHQGVEHFVRSQRTDRTGVERDKLPQDEPVRHTMLLNAEALMNISARRLCRKASPETRKAWTAVRLALRDVDPVLFDFCQPQCMHAGMQCIEMRPCGMFPYAQTFYSAQQVAP